MVKRIVSYDSGSVVKGRPSKELVKQSSDNPPTGAVWATLDPSTGLWEYIQDDEVAYHRDILHQQVLVVWIEER